MASVAKLIFCLFLFVITIAEGGKKHVEKIVIHVPYKIHKHHHTHTKYKVITIPTPKKENTIIYLKEEVQPLVKHVPPVKIQTEVIEGEHKAHEPFIPPHQQSASALIQSLSHHKEQIQDQQGLSTVVQEQKPQDTQMGDNTDELVPNVIYKPIVLPSHNLSPHFPFKPILLQPQHVYMPKLLVNPGIHPSYDAFYPKLAYQPMVHTPKSNYNHNYKHKAKPILPPKKDLQDNEAHSSSQVYKTVINPRQKMKPYKVKEESPEDIQLVKHQQTTTNSVSVPSMKSNRNGKTYFQHLKNVEEMIKSNPDYEYEHIGYLIIDGNSKKVVGKNFKDEIHLTR